MKDDARRFMFTIVSIPALLASAAGVHAVVTPPAIEPIVEETPAEKPVPVVVTKTPTAPPKKTATAPVRKVITVTPAPVVTPPPVYTYTPPDPTPAPRTVVVRRVRTTSAS